MIPTSPPGCLAARFAAPVAAVVMAFAAAFGTAAAQPAPQGLPTVRLNAGIHNIQAELAQTPEQRSVGLMHRPSMAAPHGDRKSTRLNSSHSS